MNAWLFALALVIPPLRVSVSFDAVPTTNAPAAASNVSVLAGRLKSRVFVV